MVDWDLDPKGFISNMLVAYEPVVRQRAYMTMLAIAKGSEQYVYYPNLLSLKWVMSVVGYADYEPYSASDYHQEGYDDALQPKRDEDLIDVRKFIGKLPKKIRMNGFEDEGRDIMLSGTDETATIENSKIVHVPLLNEIFGSTMNIVEPEY